MPVMFSPGLLRFVTRPSCIGSKAVSKTIGMVVPAAFAARMVVSPPVLDLYIPAIDVASFCKRTEKGCQLAFVVMLRLRVQKADNGQ